MKLLINVIYKDGTTATFELISKNVEAHSVLTDNHFVVGLMTKDVFWETKFKDQPVIEVNVEPI